MTTRSANSRRARYTAGVVEGKPLIGYAESDGVKPARNTETLAEMTVTVDNWRWAGVPFVLRSGKALESAPQGRHHHLQTGAAGAGRLPRRGRPRRAHPRVSARTAPRSGSSSTAPATPRSSTRSMLRTEFGPGDLSAYGEVLAGVLDGDPSLSVRGDTAEECWRIVQPVIDAWRADQVPLDGVPGRHPRPGRLDRVAPAGRLSDQLESVGDRPGRRAPPCGRAAGPSPLR